MNYNFPATKFVKTNSERDQLRHIVSEMAEVMDAIIKQEGIIAGQVERELMDLTHSLESLWRMLPDTDHLVEITINKNDARGYYDD